MKQGQKARILTDLLKGLHANMINDIKRYGTSCRSRISDLRKDGYPVQDYIPDGEHYKIYYLPSSFLEKYHAEKVSA